MLRWPRNGQAHLGRARRHLDEALDLSPEKRPILLDRLDLEPSDRELLEKLIAAAEGEGDTLAPDASLGGRLRADVAEGFTEEVSARPDSIPGYRLLRRIGSGGMGHVWEAEQLEPVQVWE